MQGILIKAISGFYYAECGGEIYECKARGNFRKAGVSPVVGDRVEISVSADGKGVVEEILPRKNVLERPTVANIDKLVIVSAYETPAPDPLMIDRLTAIAVYRQIKPVIVFNKSDLGDFGELCAVYRKAGFPTYAVSALDPETLTELRTEFDGCVCAFAGNSGVGKSSLINALFDGLSLETGEVSEKLGRGRHTTRHTRLFATPNGGYVVDTPGFSSVSPGDDYEFKDCLPACFSDFSDYTDRCRFTSCTHTCEKDCGVLQAVAAGEISRSRHDGYCALYRELKDLKAWNSPKPKKK